MTAAERIAEWLANRGVSHAFGIVGAGILPIWDAITRLGKTQIICCHHEQAAATAAASMNRMDYRLRAIALVTSGGGAANAITGVMGAHMDSIPLIIVSGNEPSKYLRSKERVLGVQGFRAAPVAEPFTKVALTLGDGNLEGTLATIWLAATEPRSGAVWLDCPRNKHSCMTDLQIVQLCAKAMGYSSVRRKGDEVHAPLGEKVSGIYWPLEDDAQAMALVKRFTLNIKGDGRFWLVYIGDDQFWAQEKDLNRAICESVARIYEEQ